MERWEEMEYCLVVPTFQKDLWNPENRRQSVQLAGKN
tara:strand:+ start:849 stop:959 length:111 start_codon:yes stop_codon:yes gene_type:complete